MKHYLSVLLITLTAALISGCASWGNFAVPPHTSSLKADRDVLCLSVSLEEKKGGQEASGLVTAGLTFIATEGISWLHGKLVEAGRVEAGRYTATTSGKTTTPYYKTTTRQLEDDEKASVVFEQMRTMEVRRVVFDSAESVMNCDDVAKLALPGMKPVPGEIVNDAARLMSILKLDFDTKIGLVGSPKVGTTEQKLASTAKGGKAADKKPSENKERVLFRLVPKELKLYGVKAKVPTWSWWRPWTWLAATRPDYMKIDLNYTLGLSGHALYERSGGDSPVDNRVQVRNTYATIDIPVTGIKVPSEGESTTVGADALSSSASDWFELPYPSQLPIYKLTDKNDGYNSLKVEGHGNLTIKAVQTETNKLGDVIAAELDRAEKRKDERVKKAVDKLLEAID